MLPNRQFGQLIDIAPQSLIKLSTTYTEFSSIEVWFTDQKREPLEIEDNFRRQYRKYVKEYGFLSFARKFGDEYGKKLMDTATKAWIDAAKTASKRAVQTTAEAKGDLIGNKIAVKITSLGKQRVKKKKM